MISLITLHYKHGATRGKTLDKYCACLSQRDFKSTLNVITLLTFVSLVYFL